MMYLLTHVKGDKDSHVCVLMHKTTLCGKQREPNVDLSYGPPQSATCDKCASLLVEQETRR